jgi:hypothetical protein
MYYMNFNDKITAKYRMVCNGWPLPKFCSPSDLCSHNEVEVLYHAWKSDTASFRRLSDEEWEKWDQARFQEALSLMANGKENDGSEGVGSNPSMPATSSPSKTSVTTDMNAPQQLKAMSNPLGLSKRKAAPLGDSVVANSLTSISGDSIVVTKKLCKQCSDAGKKRGPRKVANGSTLSSRLSYVMFAQ